MQCSIYIPLTLCYDWTDKALKAFLRSAVWTCFSKTCLGSDIVGILAILVVCLIVIQHLIIIRHLNKFHHVIEIHHLITAIDNTSGGSITMQKLIYFGSWSFMK